MIRFPRSILLLVTGTIVLSCSGPGGRFFRPSADQIIEKALAGDAEFLKSADPSFFDTLIRKKPGSAYYIACRLQELKLPEEAELLFGKTFAGDIDPWRREAGLELGRLLDRDGSEAEFLLHTRRFRDLYPDDAEGGLLHFTALLRAGRDEELLAEAASAGAAGAENGLPKDGSSALLRLTALAQKRLGRPEWKETVRVLFRSHPAGAAHGRAYEELVRGSDAAFPAAEAEFFRAKARRAAGANDAARAGYKAAPGGYLKDPVVIREYGDILQKTGRYREGAKELEMLLPRLNGEALLAAREYLGRLYRLTGRYDKSAAVLKKALLQAEESESASNEDRDRLIWYILSSALRQSPDAMLRELPHLSPKMKNPAYFSDLFESLASGLVRGRMWPKLLSAYELTKERAAPADKARFAFLLAAAVHHNLYRPPESSLPSVRELLETAAAEGEPYYAILAGLALGRPLPPAAEEEAPAAEELSPEDRFVRGFVEFQLSRRGVESAASRLDSLHPETVVTLAASEGSEGRYIDSLRLLHKKSRRDDFPPSRRALEVLYPLAYRSQMETVISEVSLPPAMFYGLVREESYFDASIRSGAGAVGLAQLMPATARDVARRLRIDNPELTDPLTNLRLGSRFLKDLYNRFGTGVHALAGYNAGGGRVSRWKKQLRGLPGVLFAEAIPFAETREYIRKVLVSAVHYGYLYDEKSPVETVSEIFSDFMPK